jgi:hypothetical protein
MMKIAGNENPNSLARLHINPSLWSGSSEPSTLIQSGWKAGKNPAAGEVFFLTFPFIELIKTWPRTSASNRTMLSGSVVGKLKCDMLLEIVIEQCIAASILAFD